jgi:hypothetical protein
MDTKIVDSFVQLYLRFAELLARCDCTQANQMETLKFLLTNVAQIGLVQLCNFSA